jgi:hypothetical protein
VGGVLGEQRAGDRAALAQRTRGIRRHDGLAAQDAVLIRKRQPHDLERVFRDQLVDAAGGLDLFVAPQPVTLDEARRPRPPLR